MISTALALIAYRRGWLERPVLIVTSILYTIPSLALFELLAADRFGLSRTTAEVALVSYTLLIMFRNTLTGLREVPAEVRDAAAGMGMGPTQSLLRVELPLAAPAIIAGLRIATVTVISLATVAALIDNEGLGVPILTAISNEVFKTELIVAGAMAVALALAADALLVLAQRLLTPWTRATGGADEQLRRGLQVHRPQRAGPGRAAAADARPPDPGDDQDRGDRDRRSRC